MTTHNLTNEQRIELLEKRGAGPRGPAGDISSAVNQAMLAVSDAESRVEARASAHHKLVTNKIAAFRKEISDRDKEHAEQIKVLRDELRAHRDFVTQHLKAEVDAATVQVLQDYKLLNDQAAPSAEYIRHEVEKIVEQKLLAAK